MQANQNLKSLRFLHCKLITLLMVICVSDSSVKNIVGTYCSKSSIVCTSNKKISICQQTVVYMLVNEQKSYLGHKNLLFFMSTRMSVAKILNPKVHVFELEVLCVNTPTLACYVTLKRSAWTLCTIPLPITAWHVVSVRTIDHSN